MFQCEYHFRHFIRPFLCFSIGSRSFLESLNQINDQTISKYRKLVSKKPPGLALMAYLLIFLFILDQSLKQLLTVFSSLEIRFGSTDCVKMVLFTLQIVRFRDELRFDVWVADESREFSRP